MSRHMFFGANTPRGFHSFFNNILFPRETQKLVYLKGSSGSGKSTLMRKIAEAFEAKGMEVDYIHCSNNITDLDGICVRTLGIGMVDGTAPHVCDPVIPVAIDEIFNTADYINRDYVTERAKELLDFQSQKKGYYDKAYNYLNAAYQIYGNNSYIHRQALNVETLNKAISEELAVFKDMEIRTPGLNRKFFADAITPQGIINNIGTMINGRTVTALCGADGTGTEIMLEAIKSAANIRGLDTESAYSPLNIEKLEHLLIPGINLCFTTVNDFTKADFVPDREIRFESFIDRDFIDEHTQELRYNDKMFYELLNRGMDMMAAQKKIHDRIEEIYVSAMDFNGLNKASEDMIADLLTNFTMLA